MDTADYDRLETDIKKYLAACEQPRFAIVGHTPLAYHVVALLTKYSALDRLAGIYGTPTANTAVKPIAALKADRPGVVVIAENAEKERLLEQACPHLLPTTKVVLVGYEHFHFRDPVFKAVTESALVPSLANGYQNSLIHLFQCLQNAARLDLDGLVVEFGMFRGGTTMNLSRFIERLGRGWKVVGFDTFDGFPPPRSVLDMYDHPDCVFRDEASVRHCFKGRNVEIVSGDIVETAPRLKGTPIVLAFIDTDNYTSGLAAIDAVKDSVVRGGAIVFDHFTGRNRHKDTLGERIAAKTLLEDPRYFNLHDTGVFIKQL